MNWKEHKTVNVMRNCNERNIDCVWLEFELRYHKTGQMFRLL